MIPGFGHSEVVIIYHEDLLRMGLFMLFAAGVIPPPSDGLPSAFPLSYQQSPVKMRIHWNQKKPGDLNPALLQALLQAIQLLSIGFSLNNQLAQDGINTMHPNFLWPRDISLLEAPVEKTPDTSQTKGADPPSQVCWQGMAILCEWTTPQGSCQADHPGCSSVGTAIT